VYTAEITPPLVASASSVASPRNSVTNHTQSAIAIATGTTTAPMDDAMAPNVGRVMRARAHLPSGGRRSGAMPTEAACAARRARRDGVGPGWFERVADERAVERVNRVRVNLTLHHVDGVYLDAS